MIRHRRRNYWHMLYDEDGPIAVIGRETRIHLYALALNSKRFVAPIFHAVMLRRLEGALA